MKILRIVSSGYEQGGVENGIVLTNDILRAHGHEVRTIASNLRPDLTHYSDYEFAAIPRSGIKKIINGTFNISAYKITKKVLREFQPDIVLLHTLSQPTVSVLFTLKKYPVIYFIHGPELFIKALLPWSLPQDAYKHGSYQLSDLTLYGKARYIYFRLVIGQLYRLGLRNVNQLMALSHYTQQILKDQGIESHYMPNGAKLLNSVPLRHENNSILYVGRLEKFKGVNDLIKAMPAIIKSVPSAKLHLVGEGSYQDELKNLARDLHVEKAVIFHGFINNQQRDKHYSECNVLILPSTWPETFGKVGIEAMSVGRPVIATDVGGIRDWLINGRNGFLVQPGCPEQIANKIIAILSNKTLASKLSDQAIKTASKFSITLMAQNIENLINKYTD
jgi:glycosyltransferase involved in cell wall biosynthesis